MTVKDDTYFLSAYSGDQNNFSQRHFQLIDEMILEEEIDNLKNQNEELLYELQLQRNLNRYLMQVFTSMDLENQ